MSCKHPLKRFIIEPRAPTSKGEGKICSYNTDHIYRLQKNGPWIASESWLGSPHAVDIRREFELIPCGKCIECRLAYSRNWADRCMMELEDHKSSYFVTLTYDDEHVHKNDWFNEDTGEFGNIMTLCKVDLQKFFKRLRYYHGEKIRYFSAGEYGETSLRPHYHAIIFGLELIDLVFYKRSSQGFNYYLSESLSKIWSHGYVVVTEVSWDTCAYTARYVMKKQKGLASAIYTKYNFEPEFTLMSRKPGIARKWYDEHKSTMYNSAYINITTPTGGHKCRPPKYFDNLYDAEFPEEMYQRKLDILDATKDMDKIRLSHTDKNDLDAMQTEENALISKTKILRRNKDYG